MTPTRLWILTYDVPDDNRRQRLHDLLRLYGRRLQYSVFEARLTGSEVQGLLRRAQDIVDPEADQLVAYVVPRRCEAEICVIGRAREELVEETFFIV